MLPNYAMQQSISQISPDNRDSTQSHSTIVCNLHLNYEIYDKELFSNIQASDSVQLCGGSAHVVLVLSDHKNFSTSRPLKQLMCASALVETYQGSLSDSLLCRTAGYQTHALTHQEDVYPRERNA